MWIIAGDARGRKIEAPEGRDTRPTLDRVRENLFNMLQGEIAGSRVLDLFAGSGAIGIEALSRGARHAVFVENSRKALQVIKDNIHFTKFEDESDLILSDAVSYVRGLRVVDFDVIFIDPPYDSGLYDEVLQAINSFDILSEGGIIVVEARRETPLPDMKAPYRKIKEYRYGKVKICIYTRESSL